MKMRNIIVGQSGGPTAVINSSLYGITMAAKEKGVNVYGMLHGIEGFLEDNYINLTELAEKDEEEFALLKTTPASFLGSCRYKLPEDLNDSVYRIIFDKLAELKIDAFFYIGGNDSMDTADKLSRYAKEHKKNIIFMGVPKTIDNDLVVTDHCPGYGSTAKYIASTVRNIVWDSGVYARPVVTIVELMGRNAGWVTAASVLARTPYEKNPMLIYLPEENFDITEFIKDVKHALTISSTLVICVSEGIHDSTGKLICEYGEKAETDRFGHKMLTGCGKVLERYIKRSIDCKSRTIELSLTQRAGTELISATDSDEAENAGRVAFNSAFNDGMEATGKMVAFMRSDDPYTISYELVPVKKVCNKEKFFPKKWIVNGNDISDEFLKYVLPLIQGEPDIKYEDGVPKLMKPAYIDK
jgi:ATP-dependent phosphofructokinase / diphosphate-dependent phosphofructokinase